MNFDDHLKALLQLAADVQDGFFDAATRVEDTATASLLQAIAVEWNAFADRIFPILLQIDHTSPDAKWYANPDRDWMNAHGGPNSGDDPAICSECLRGLEGARFELHQAIIAAYPPFRPVLDSQIQLCGTQIDRLSTALKHTYPRPDHRSDRNYDM